MNEDQAAAEIKALRDSGRHADACEVGYRHLQAFPDSWKVRGMLAWAVWSHRIKGASNAGAQPTQIVDAVREVRRLTEFRPYGNISAYVQSVQDAVSLLSEANRHTTALTLLDEVDPAQLSREPNQFQNRRYPGQLERWFNDLSKTLSALQDWPRLADTCEKALASGLYLTDEDRVWINYRLALSLIDTDPSRALGLIDQVKKIKNESWLIRHRARCLYNLGQHEQAEQECRVALGGVNLKKPEFAIRILEDMYNYTEDDETATDILQALRAIRIANEWPAKEEYEQAAKELGCQDPSGFPYGDVIKKFADGAAFRAQRADSTSGGGRGGRTKASKNVLDPSASGVVARLLPTQENVSFVKVEGRGDVLMTRNDNPDIPWPPVVGQRVSGTLVESMDRKKQRMSAKFIAAKPS